MTAVSPVGSSVVAYALPQKIPPDSPFAKLIAQYAKDRQAAFKLIGSLQGRIRQLEQDLSRERVDRSREIEAYDQELFDLSQAVQELSEQIQGKNQEMDRLLQRVCDLERRNENNSATITALREEVAALTRQVAQKRAQVEALSNQIQAAATRENQRLTDELQKAVVQQPPEDCSPLAKVQAALRHMLGIYKK